MASAPVRSPSAIWYESTRVAANKSRALAPPARCMTNCSPLQPPCKVAALLPEAPHGSRPSRHDADRNPRGTDRVVRGGQQAEVAVSHWHRAREVRLHGGGPQSGPL